MTPADRFMDKVSPEPNCGCWLWTGAYHRQGYGQFALDGRNPILAHRASWFLFNGEMPPPTTKVCHSCDVPSCVNPDHLWLGSQKANVRDCVAKGRFIRNVALGERNGQARLTQDDVNYIRQSPKRGIVLARELNVAQSTISMIRRGHNWWNSEAATRRAEMKL